MTGLLFNRIDEIEEKYIDFLSGVCNIESPTSYKEGVDEVGRYFAQKAKEKGWRVETHPIKNAGDVVVITMNPDVKNAPICLSAHIDTVHPIGLFGNPAVKIDKENIYGPGVMDCKGGAVTAFMAMDALSHIGFKERPVMLLLQTDEECGSSISNKETINYICERSRDAVAFLNLEGFEGHAVLYRKGILRVKFTVHGKAGHSAKCYLYANAVCEAAHKIVELEKLKDEDGLTCNCGVIEGGTVANSVAEECTFLADIRFSSSEELLKAREIIESTTKKVYVEGCTTEWTELSFRPAMEHSEKNVALFNRINEIFSDAGLSTVPMGTATGGSDAAYTTLAGIPTIDNLGTEGGYIHSVREYAKLSSICESAKRIAAIALKI